MSLDSIYDLLDRIINSLISLIEKWIHGTRTLTGHSYSVNDLSYSPDGRYLAFDTDSRIRIWDTSRWTES